MYGRTRLFWCLVPLCASGTGLGEQSIVLRVGTQHVPCTQHLQHMPGWISEPREEALLDLGPAPYTRLGESLPQQGWAADRYLTLHQQRSPCTWRKAKHRGERAEDEILLHIRTALKRMSCILSFENWIPWVVIESFVRPMGLSSSAWIFLSSHTREIKEALDHALTLPDSDSSK